MILFIIRAGCIETIQVIYVRRKFRLHEQLFLAKLNDMLYNYSAKKKLN